MDSKLAKDIEKCNDIAALGKCAASNQYDYWYDPCGKSGHEFNERLSKTSKACLKRIGQLIGLEKK